MFDRSTGSVFVASDSNRVWLGVLFFLWVAFRWSTLCRLRRTSTAELTLTYDEALEEGSVPDKGRFEVSLAGGAAQAVSAVAVDGSEVTLILATPALFGQTVTLT